MSGSTTTADIDIPERLIDQVVGQERAVEIIRLAARQKRFVLLVGEPGTGKSLLATAMAELLSTTGLEDVLVEANPASPMSPRMFTIPAGQGPSRVRQARAQRRRADQGIQYLFLLAGMATALVSLFYSLTRGSALYLAVGAALLAMGWLARRHIRAERISAVPKLLVAHGDPPQAPFIDATGFHSGALLGDVRHDPFQSGGYETPPHELIEAGAIHQAHGGVLYIDEASTLGQESQLSLLTAIQEKRFPISGRSPGSSGSMVHTGPVPCDFVLVLAGNREDLSRVHPALRSRIRGFGYEVLTAATMPDDLPHRAQLARFVAQEVNKDGKIPHFSMAAVDQIIVEARHLAMISGRLTCRLRELGGLIRAAGDLAVADCRQIVEADHVIRARERTLSLEQQAAIEDVTPAAHGQTRGVHPGETIDTLPRQLTRQA